MRLIDADALEEALREHKFDYSGQSDYFDGVVDGLMLARDDVREAPTIDAEPIRHGKWRKVDYQICVGKGAFVDALECSVCEEPNYEMSNYCPRCGAKMYKEEL